jgi:hypothetical protein
MSPLTRGCFATADDTYSTLPLGMNQNENAVLDGQTDVDIAFLRFGTINVWIGKQEGIIENRLAFIEGHFVPFEVLSGFDFIPFKQKHLTFLRTTLYRYRLCLTIETDSCGA